MKVIVPKNYKTPLDIRETEVAIKKLKDRFEEELSEKVILPELEGVKTKTSSSPLR